MGKGSGPGTELYIVVTINGRTMRLCPTCRKCGKNLIFYGNTDNIVYVVRVGDDMHPHCTRRCAVANALPLGVTEDVVEEITAKEMAHRADGHLVAVSRDM